MIGSGTTPRRGQPFCWREGPRKASGWSPASSHRIAEADPRRRYDRLRNYILVMPAPAVGGSQALILVATRDPTNRESSQSVADYR